jgi:hypothetical protein
MIPDRARLLERPKPLCRRHLIVSTGNRAAFVIMDEHAAARAVLDIDVEPINSCQSPFMDVKPREMIAVIW